MLRQAREKRESRDEGRRKKCFSSPSSPASGKMPRSPRLAHKAAVMEAKSSVHRLVFIVFNYTFAKNFRLSKCLVIFVMPSLFYMVWTSQALRRN